MYLDDGGSRSSCCGVLLYLGVIRDMMGFFTAKKLDIE